MNRIRRKPRLWTSIAVILIPAMVATNVASVVSTWLMLPVFLGVMVFGTRALHRRRMLNWLADAVTSPEYQRYIAGVEADDVRYSSGA